MNKYISIPIIGAVITAFLSTLCCLPAFLFLFFGFSSSFFSYFTSIEYLRLPMTVLSIVFFLFAIRGYKKGISCKKSKKEQIKQYLLLSMIFLSVCFLLFYPEIISYFMEEI